MSAPLKAKATACAAALLIALTLAMRADAAPRQVSGRITYVSSASVYLDLGSGDGLRLGQVLSAQRGETVVAELQVTALSERSSSARVVRRTVEVRPGDPVAGLVDVTPPVKKAMEAERRASDPTPAEIEALWARALIPRPVSQEGREPSGETQRDMLSSQPEGRTAEAHLAREVRGRVSVGYLRTDEGSGVFDFSQPSVTAQISAERIGGTPLDLSLYVRGRRDFGHNLSNRPGANSRPTLRFYEVSLTSRNPDARYNYGIGRLCLDRLSGVGTFDGANFTWLMNSHVQMGLLAGLQPRLTDSAFQDRGSKLGAFVTFEHAGPGGLRPSLTTAFVRQRAEGGARSDFLYAQGSLPLKTLYLYQSSEFVLNRAGRGSLQPANTSLSLSYFPSPAISLTASYDAWKSVPELEGADSLFVVSLRQGLGLDLQLRLTHGLRLYGRASTRMQGGEAARTTAGAVGIGAWSAWGTGFAPDVRYTVVRGALVDASQLDFSLRRPLYRSAILNADFQRYRYHLPGGPFISRYTARLGLVRWMSRRLYLDIDQEGSWGDGFRVSRSFLEVTARW